MNDTMNDNTMNDTMNNTTMNNAMKTCKEMCITRGYVIEKYDNTFIKAQFNGDKIYCFFITANKFNIDIVKYYYSILYKDDITHVIFIYKNDITSSVKKILQEINTLKVELFSERELQYNITKHYLVPKHTRISSHNFKELDKFPIIRKTDPICRFYDWNVGDLIQIERKNKSIYYRIVK